MARAEITMDANDEVVVVFGGSSGIGEAVARTMAVRGSQVVIAGRDPARLAAAAGRVGRAVQMVAVDADDRDAVDAFFAGLPADADHLVLSFSTGRAGGPFRDLPMADLAAAALEMRPRAGRPFCPAQRQILQRSSRKQPPARVPL